MNERHLGLKADPFSLASDPEVFYRSTQHVMAESVLEYALESRTAFCLLTGGIGCGKSLLVSRLLGKLGDDVLVARINHPHTRLTSIYPLLACALDIECDGGADLHQVLVHSLQQEYAKGRRTLIVVDEAQNLSVEVLEELRLLSNANADSNFLQTLLVGESELRERLHRPELAHLAQRISAQCHLTALEMDETHSYIRHRLQIAGGNPSLFTPEAMNLVHMRTQGVPRLINQLCHFVLAQAHANERMRIDAELMAEVPPECPGSLAVQATPEPALRARQRADVARSLRPLRVPTINRSTAAIAAAVALALVGGVVWRFYGSRSPGTVALVVAKHSEPALTAPTPAPVVVHDVVPLIATASAETTARPQVVAREVAPPAPTVDPVPAPSVPTAKEDRAVVARTPVTASLTPTVATHSPAVRPIWYLSRASERLNAGDSAAAERLLSQASAAGATAQETSELRAGIEAQKLELRLMAAGDQVRAAIASNSLIDPASDDAETRYQEMSTLSPTDPLTLRAKRELHAALLSHAQEALHKDQLDVARRYLAAVARIGPSPDGASVQEELNRKGQRASTASAAPATGEPSKE